jgi:hypothetical protein
LLQKTTTTTPVQDQNHTEWSTNTGKSNLLSGGPHDLTAWHDIIHRCAPISLEVSVRVGVRAQVMNAPIVSRMTGGVDHQDTTPGWMGPLDVADLIYVQMDRLWHLVECAVLEDWHKHLG